MKLDRKYRDLSIAILLILFTSCFIFSGCLGGTRSQMRPTANSLTQNVNPTGAWEGLIQHGIDFAYIRLEIENRVATSPGKQAYSGKAYLQQFSQHLAGRDVKNDIKAETIPVTFNYEPSIRRFSIVPGNPGRYGINRLSTLLRNLGGVYDAKSEVLTGLRNSRGYGRSQPNTGNQFFLFARPRHFETICEKFETFKQNRFSGIGGGLGTGIGLLMTKMSGPDADDIRKWIGKYYAIYPETDFYRSAHGMLELQALKLFRDAHFSRYFGKPFDELSRTELNGIRFTLEKKFKTSRNRKDRSTGALGRMFWVGNGDNSAKQTTLWTIAQRHYLNWYHGQLDHLSSVQGGRSAFNDIALLEAELEKAKKILFWPEDIKTNQTQIANARKRVAYPILDKMIAAWKLKTHDFQLVRNLSEWDRTEHELFSQVGQQQRLSLMTRRDALLDDVLENMTRADGKSLQALADGLAAIAAGNRWYHDVQQRYRPVLSHPLVKALMEKFYQARHRHINQEIPVMRQKLRSIAKKMPAGYSPDNDKRRLTICSELKRLKKQWFALPRDSSVPAAQSVIAEIDRLGANVAGFLPPSLAAQTTFASAYTPEPKASHVHLKAKVPSIISRFMGQNDWSLKKALSKPIADPGFRFKSQEIWAIFHGRFELLDSRYSNQQGLGSKWIARAMNINPQFHFAFVSWVGLSSQKHGRNQFGNTSTVSWKTTQGGRVVRKGWGKVYMTDALFPFYERSYKIAENATRNDALFGGNGLEFFNLLLQYRAGDWFGKTRVRPDGEVKFAANWEKPILYDLKCLLDHWPAQSWGLWQLQENLLRFLEGKPSVQQLYNWG